MNKTSRVYARMLFVGDIMIVGGNQYIVTSITQWPNAVEAENVRIEFHYSDEPERKINLIAPATETFQIKHR